MTYDIQTVSALVKQALVLAEETADAALAKQDDLGGLCALVLARACQSLHSVNILGANGMIGDAMSVARTPVEMTIDLAYIALDPAKRIPMFTDYDHISKYKLASAVAALHGGKVPTDAMQELKRRADEAKANNPDSEHNWAGVSVKKRAQAANRMQMYDLLYADMCTASHSCYGSLEYALADVETNPRIVFGNMSPDDKPIVLAAGALLLLVDTTVEACNLDTRLGDRSTELVNAFTGRNRYA